MIRYRGIDLTPGPKVAIQPQYSKHKALVDLGRVEGDYTATTIWHTPYWHEKLWCRLRRKPVPRMVVVRIEFE